MDMERFPSGKFATNQLVMACTALVSNILGFIGHLSLVTSRGVVRHPTKRRRIKRGIQKVIFFAGRALATGRHLALRFSGHVAGHVAACRYAYQRLAYG
jgi:hypothetical protein